MKLKEWRRENNSLKGTDMESHTPLPAPSLSAGRVRAVVKIKTCVEHAVEQYLVPFLGKRQNQGQDLNDFPVSLLSNTPHNFPQTAASKN